MFATTINCIDGRVQLPVINYLMGKYQVKYIDSITEPGPVKLFADEFNPENLKSIIEKINISVHKHGSKNITIVAHFDCAGNPVPDHIQKEQLKTAVPNLKTLVDPEVDIIGIWVNEDYSIEEIQ